MIFDFTFWSTVSNSPPHCQPCGPHTPSTMPLEPKMEQTSSSRQCNYKWKNISPYPNQPTPSQPARLSSLTSPTSSTVSPVKHSSKSSQIPSLKSSPSPTSSTNKRGPSTTNGPMAHGAPSSWRKASAKAAHSHPFLPHLLSQTSSNHSTSNYMKEPPLAFKTVTRGMMALEALSISLVTSMTSPHTSPSKIYNSFAADLLTLGYHWDASSTQ